ncbi:MAG: hypothetical protein U0V87_07965 [Acidobacteriota bacterium]
MKTKLLSTVLAVVSCIAVFTASTSVSRAALGVCDTAGPLEIESSGGTVTPTAYATLGAAFSAINAGTHTGTIDIEVCGNTAEGATVALLNASGSGSASYTTITVKPVGGAARSISGATTAGSPMIDLSGADNVTINGLNSGGNTLTLSNTTASGTSGTATVRFINGATNNTITNTTVSGSFSAAVATNGGNIYFATDGTTTAGNDNNTISNCDIGPAGANLPTKGIYGNGTTTNAAIGNNGIVITNNNIFDYFGAAVASAGVYVGGGNSGWTITNNKFYQTATRTWTTGADNRAINIQNSTATTGAQGFTITGNVIGFSSSAGTGTYTLTGSTGKFAGIVFNGVSAGTLSSISSNTIASVSLTGVTSSSTGTSSPFMGILVTNGVANTNSNTFGSQSATGSLVFSTNTTTATDVYGIYNFSVDNWTANGNTFGGITASNAGASGAYIVYLMRANTSTSVGFTADSNILGGTVANSIQNNSTSTTAQLIGIATGNATGNFTGNTIRNLTAAGGTGTSGSASIIGLLSTTTSTNHTMSRNTIHTLANTNATAATTVIGIQYTGGTGTNTVARNFIHSFNAASTAAILNGINVSGGTTSYINNMVRLGVDAAGAPITIGMQINGISEPLGTDKFYFNSVYVGGSGVAGSAATYAFNSQQTVNTRVFQDNIFFNARSNGAGTGKHYAVRVGGSTPNPTGLTINYNVYFVSGTGGVFGFFNGADVADLNAWRTAVGQDANSIFGDPKYLTPAGTAATVDLHINPASTTPIEGNGLAIAGITDDFDGDIRANFGPTDIGADAGNFLGVDLTAPTITYTPLPNTTSTADRTLSISVTDTSGVPTTGIGLPQLYFRKGTSGAYSASQCSFVSGSNYTCTFTYASVGGVVVGDKIQYYVAAQDNANNVTTNPLAGASGFSANPPAASTPPTTPNAYNIAAALSGTKTVCASGCDYASLTNTGGLFETVNAAVLTGNLIIDITGDLAGETGSVALNQWTEDGVGGYTLTIRPTGGARSITGTGTGTTLIKLNGADRVTIDGSVGGGGTDRSLTLNNTNTANGTGVLFIASLGTGAGATNVTVKNCLIRAGGIGTSANFTYGVFVGDTGGASAGADNDNLTLQNNQINLARTGIQIVGTAAGLVDNAQILDNLVGDNTLANSLGRIGVLVSTANAATISGNSIKNIFLSGDTSTPIGLSTSTLTNSTISQNTITNVQSGSSSPPAGLTMATASSGNTITRNTIDTVQGNAGASGDPVGLSLGSGVTNTSATRNTISNVTYLGTGGYGGRGIDINTGNATSGLTIANNSVSNIKGDGWNAFSSDSIVGIRITGTTGGINLYYNSVNLGSGSFAGNTSGTLSAAIYVASTVTALDIRDNALATNLVNSNAATAKSYAIYSDAPSTSFTDINYNDYFATGTQGTLGFLTSARTTLAQWQSATGKDANSLAVDPLFNSATNLQPQLGSPLLLAGTPIAGINIDLTGATRDAFTPTIGAYESALDTAGPTISYTSLTNTTSTSNRTQSISVTDASGVPTSGVGLPVIYFRKGTSGAYASSQCSFVSASNYDCLIDYSLVTGGSVAVGDTIQYYVAAQDTVGNVSTNPSAGASGFTANPPAASTPPSSPNSYLISAAITGSYLVGSGETITSLTNPGGMFETINNGVLTGNVTIDLTSDSTAETGTVALNQWAEEGVGSYTVTIRPSGGVARTVSGSATAGLIKLNGADRVTIDGLNTGGNALAITNTSAASGAAVIWLASQGTGQGASNNTIRNVAISGASNTANSWGICVGGATLCANGADNDNVTIQGNTFSKLLNGIIVVGTAATSSGGVDGLSIANNVVGPAVSGADNIGLNGVLIANTVAPTVSNNTVRNVVSTTNTVAGIALNGGVTNAVVTRNTVSGMSAAASSTTAYGIFAGSGSTGASISRNSVSSIIQTSTAGYPARGIFVNTGVTGSAVVIANNSIFDIQSYSDPSTSFSFQPVGIMIDGTTGGVSLYHNSINLFGAHPGLSSATLQACLFVGASATALDVRDNIFSISYDNSSSSTDKSYAVYSNAPASSFTNINYNDYYATGTTGVLGFLGSDRTSLAAWQTATGQDAASVVGDPLFNSNTDLHINISGALSAVENVGTPIAGVTVDIDGDTRSVTTPDIGSDEVDRCLNVTCPTNTTCASYACNQSTGTCDATFAPNTTVCRSSSAVCDTAETCTGASATCPADLFEPVTTVCRVSGGSCDVAESCTGTGPNCPADVLVPAATECRASSGICDVAESCNGISAACPSDNFEPITTVCRASGGACDLAETCTGTGPSCPADQLEPATTVCRTSGGLCDIAESCTGTGVDCPADVLEPATTVCRTSAGTCDVAESCTGSSATCPTDLFEPATTECRASGGVCDVAESCTGLAATCPANLFLPDTTVCRASTATCDPAELCTGSGASCPADAVNMSDPVGNTVSVTHNTFTAISTISWAEASAGPFNVYRGGLWSSRLWSDNEGCFSSNVPMMSVSDFTTPTPGSSFFYLVTRKTSTCTESNLGQRSSGADRPMLNSCPSLGPDTDGDTVLDMFDNCAAIANLNQLDTDLDSLGDLCDNCPLVFNPDQEDTDNNGIGNACE